MAGRVAWLDASSGASGDMLLGALLGAGVPLEVIRAAVDAVVPEPVDLRPESTSRNGFAATRCHVQVADSVTERSWSDVRALIERSALDPVVLDVALEAFGRIAEAEAAVHGVAVDDVHFHEVGALDSIADVVGVAAGFVHLGLSWLVCSPVALGGGTVRIAHGEIGVPAPAVVELLRGLPSYGGPVDLELTTPTGAALLAVLADDFGPQPPMAVDVVGVGAGGRDPEGHANVVRLVVGAEGFEAPLALRTSTTGGGVPGAEGFEAPLALRTSTTGGGVPGAEGFEAPPALRTSTTGGGVPGAEGFEAPPALRTSTTGGGVPGQDDGSGALVIEANVDDLDPRLWPDVIAALLEAGASDAWLTPILMKKGRPAHTLHVLVAADAADRVRREVFRQTSTIGVREQTFAKHALDREFLVVEVAGQRVAVKLARLDGELMNVQPEYADVVAAARATGRPVKDVLAEAAARAWDATSRGGPV